MKDRRSRRRYLQLVGATFVVGAAGCTDDSETDADGDDPDSEDDTREDGGNTNETGTDTDGSDDDTSDTDEGEDDDSDGQTDGDEGDTAPRLADVLTWTDSYAMEIESDESDSTWRFNDGNWWLTTTTDGQTSEMYGIRTGSGTETYVVSQGQCFKTESPDRGEEQFDPQAPADDDREYVASGRTTIDGEEVYEFDIEDGVYYVSVETGYPVRYESTDGTAIQFHSWGEVDPITAPEMECLER